MNTFLSYVLFKFLLYPTLYYRGLSKFFVKSFRDIFVNWCFYQIDFISLCCFKVSGIFQKIVKSFRDFLTLIVILHISRKNINPKFCLCRSMASPHHYQSFHVGVLIIMIARIIFRIYRIPRFQQRKKNLDPQLQPAYRLTNVTPTPDISILLWV